MLAVYQNGNKTDCLSFDDRSFHYGDGVFETIVVKHSHPLLWSYHLSRLKKGCKRLFLNVDFKTLNRWLNPLCQNHPESILKLVVSRQQQKRGYQADDSSEANVSFLFYPLTPLDSGPVKLCESPVFLSQQPYLAGIKHLNRLEQVIAARYLKQGFDENALFLSDKNTLVETISSNIFLIKGQNIVTPQLKKAGVKGVMRKFLIEKAKQTTGLTIETKKLTRSDLENADALFLSNSVQGLREVSFFEKQPYQLAHPLFKMAQRLIQDHF